MQSYARLLTLTAAVIVTSIVGVLFAASAQDATSQSDSSTTRRLDDSTKSVTRKVDPVPAVPPISFADSDGQELILEELSVRTAIQGMLSLTEIELRFRNPQNRRIEGRFSCTLPANAAISRFAKDVNGRLMEGEVVERLRANQVYEQFLHQMRDPALLEQEQGNRFSARIFPIEPKAPVHIVLSYTAALPLRDGVRTYAFPLRGISKVNKLTFRAFVTPIPGAGPSGKLTTSTADVTSFEETDWTPDRDIVLKLKSPAAEGNTTQILRAGDYYVASLRPKVPFANRQLPNASWLFYVDTSASSAEGAPHRIRALEEILGALPAGDRVRLVAFDQEIVTLASGSASELARTAGDLLRARLFLGGTDIGALLREVARSLREDPSRTAVIASDLVATVGEVAPHELKSAIDALPQGSIVHALILGSREDAPAAKAVTMGRGRVVRLPFTESLGPRAREAAGELRWPLGVSIDVADAGAEWIYPNRFEDVQPGDELLALGKVKAGREPQIEGRAISLDTSTFGPLLQREAHRVYLQYLAEREAAETSESIRRAIAAEQVRISIEQRVVIPRTTMLVLESEFEYQRFGLDRRALAAILTIDAGGIGRMDRRGSALTPLPERVIPVARQGRISTPGPARSLPAPPPIEEPATAPAAADFAQEAGAITGAVAETISVTAEAPSLSVASASVSSNTSADAMAMERDRETTTFRPAPPPPRAPAIRPRREQKSTGVDWTQRVRPTRESIAALEQQLRANPQDRELYNQLSESLALVGQWNELRNLALRWQPYDPENPQVYEVLGMADVELGREAEAARAFASLIEVAPGKTELLQRAGLLLLRTRRARLAEAPLRRALELRPDRANAYRHLALLLWRDGRIEEAARVLESATGQDFPGWYGNVQRVIREELGYVYRAWLQKDPTRRREIEQRAREHGADLERSDALRITLVWETDANDVDLHVVDPAGEQVFYSHKSSRSGLELYEDITQGLGPEVIRTAATQRGTYHVGVRYFAAGPMGISRGLVVVMRDDGVEIHPFRLAKGGEAIRYVAGVVVK